MVYSIDPTKWTPVITWEKLFRSKQKNFLCMPQTHFWNRNHFVGWNQRPTFFLLLLGNPLSNRRKYDILYTDKLRGNLFSQKERPLPSFHDVRSDDEWCGVANFGRSNFFDLLTANQRILGIPLTSLGIPALLQAPWDNPGWWMGPQSAWGWSEDLRCWPGSWSLQLLASCPSKNSAARSE